MSPFLRAGGSALAVLLFLSSFSIAQSAPPDLILYNGKIFTSTVKDPYVQALAIRGERIVATGTSVKVLMLRGPKTKAIDLIGRTVIPGINDAHRHLDISPANEVDLQFGSQNPTTEQVLQAVAAADRDGAQGVFLPVESQPQRTSIPG